MNGQWQQKNVSTNLCTLTLKWAKTYEFTVVAENDQGKSNGSKKENFTVIPGEFLDIFIRNNSLSLPSSLGGEHGTIVLPAGRNASADVI